MPYVSRRVVIGAIAVLATIGPRGVFAADTNTRLALRGFDPVSYFTKGRPERGSPEFTASFDGATYWFNTAEHRALFVADPDRYAPQFGGWCAMSLTRGEVVEPNPESWAIADGRLYVFGKKMGPAMFAERRASNVEKAAANWQEVRKHQ